MFKKNKTIIAIIIFTLLLTFLFPYTGDDWMWGSEAGEALLKNWFSDYNGRYAGNIIVMMLTRSRLLRMIVMTLVILGTIYLCYKIVNKEKKELFFVGFMLLLVVPIPIFRQAIVWTSGFTNYFISIFLTIVYIYLNKDIIVKSNENKLKMYCALIFILGFISALFIENLTIYNIVLGTAIIIYSYKKYKKVANFNVSYLSGAVMGALLMFSNGTYKNVIDGTDSYRTIETGILSIFKRISENYFKVIHKEMIFDNLFLNIVITTLLVVIAFRFINKSKDKKINDILLVPVTICFSYVLYTFIVTTNQSWFILFEYTKYFEGIFTLLYFISIVAITIITVSNKTKKIKLLFYLSSIIFIILPLLFITPIGSRCFLSTYIMFILYIVELSDYLFDKKAINYIGKTAILIIIVFGGFLLNIYGYIFTADYKRNKSIKEANKAVLVDVLPYFRYTWMSTPVPKYGLEKNYKAFHNIDPNIKFFSLEYDSEDN